MKLKQLLKMGTAIAFPRPFQNTNAGSTYWMADVPTGQTPPLTAVQLEAIAPASWVQIRGVGNLGETGSSTNIVSYDTWDTAVTQKGKGITDAGSPDLELARMPNDPGQIRLRAAAKNRGQQYVFKKVDTDRLTPSGTPSIYYDVGIVTGPRRPNGRNEDFNLEVFTLAFNQEQVVIAPT